MYILIILPTLIKCLRQLSDQIKLKSQLDFIYKVEMIYWNVYS